MTQLRRFRFDGATFADMLDSIADLRQRGFIINGNPTVVVDAPTGTNCIKFDGTGDCIDIGIILPMGTGNQSYTFWVKFINLATGVTGVIINNGNASSSGISIGIRDSKIRMQINGVSTSDGSTTLMIDTWYFVVMTRSSSTNTLYLNGVSEIISSTTPVTPIGTFTIGATQSYTSNLFGYVSNIVVFPMALTAQGILDIYNNVTFDYEQSLVSRWEFSEINPQDVGYKNNRNHGTGTSIAYTEIFPGHNSRYRSMYFDASANLVTVPDNSTLQMQSNFTIAGWFNCTTTGNTNYRAVGKQDDTNNTWSLALNPGNGNIQMSLKYLGTDYSVYNGATGRTAAAQGLWIHVAATFNGSAVKIYTNGFDSTTSTTAFSFTPSSAALLFGTTGGGAAWPGYLSDFRYYNTTLTNLEVRDLYEKTR